MKFISVFWLSFTMQESGHQSLCFSGTDFFEGERKKLFLRFGPSKKARRTVMKN
jgi:hypothetical protein